MRGSVKRRSKNSWTLIFDLPRSADGKRRQKWVAFHEAGDKGDLDGMTKFLTEDVSMLGGEAFITGKPACEAELEERIDNFDSDRRKTIVGKPEISLQGDVAVATYEASVGNLRAPISVTLRRQEDGIWRIWHISELWPTPRDN